MSWTAPGHPRPYDRRRRTTRAALLRLERIYLTLAALTCALVVATYVVAPRVAASSSGAFETADASRTDDAAATITQLGFFGGAITAGAPAVRAETVAPDDVVAGIPEWVQAIRATRLWADPTSDLAVASLPEWQYLHVVGVDQVWLRVEATLTDGPVSGWASLDDVGLSGPPPSWLLTLAPTTLFATSDGNETINSVPVGAAAMVWGPTKSGRISVYTPIDPTARRPGFGWLPVADVGPAPAPAGILLPSPQFHPMPIATDRVYRVVPGDTRASVAAGLGVDVPTLLAANDLAPSNSLLIGQILRLPPRPAAVAAASAPVKVRDIAPGWISPDMHGVVIDEASGEILWSRDPYSPVAPASLTKIVTALVTLDYARTTDRVRVDVDSRKMTESSVMGIFPGESLTVEDLLYGLMLPSGNDAALALAEHVAGTKEAFVDLMNAKVQSLGLTTSHFVNPHGLDAAGHVSSPYDIAMLARAGMRDPQFRALAGARSYSTSGGKGYQLGNLNQLLFRYPGADGVKIGFTDAAGKAIVGSAVHDGHRVYVAMMRSVDIYSDAATLLDWTFASYSWQ